MDRLWMIYLLKMVIFHSYVKLPEDMYIYVG